MVREKKPIHRVQMVQLLLEKIALATSFQEMIDPGTMRLFEKRAAGMKIIAYRRVNFDDADCSWTT